MSEYDFEAWRRGLNEVADECVALLERKQRDYGPKNIANAPGGPLTGLMVRMYDKIARIENLLRTDEDAPPRPSNEPLVDSFMDLANYGIIGAMVLKGYWPGTPQYADRTVVARDPLPPKSIRDHLGVSDAPVFDRKYWENQEFH